MWMKSKIASVSFVQADIQQLWELEEMPGQHHSDLSCFLNFPVKRIDGSYEVGLLWKGNQRPGDNYDQAVHRLESLLYRLERSGRKRAYEEVLIDEYSKLHAVEKELQPDNHGYYLPPSCSCERRSCNYESASGV